MYRTSDLNVSAYLVATGHELLGMDAEGQRRLFLFDDAARDEVPRYFAGATVQAEAFARAMRTLKRRLHATT